MKKFVALLLAMLLVLVNVAALADDIPTPDFDDVISGQRTNGNEGGKSPAITKTYTSNVEGVYPTETLEFTVTPAAAGYPTVTVGENKNNKFAVSGATDKYTIPVNVPAVSEYGAAGRYHYTVVETGASTTSQAVDYDTETVFNVDVYVSYKVVDGVMTNQLEETIIIYSGEEKTSGIDTAAKQDDFENTYSVGELTVTKEISGNLADPDKEFTIVITLTSDENVANDIVVDDSNATSVEVTDGVTKNWTSKTITLTAKGGQSVTISNIPTGVEYAVEETGIQNIDGSTGNTQIDKVNEPDAYAISYENEEGEISTSASSAKVTNTKEITIPTGIGLDTVPYILILAVAMLGVVLAIRKREEY